jgi:hypothetical protein
VAYEDGLNKQWFLLSAQGLFGFSYLHADNFQAFLPRKLCPEKAKSTICRKSKQKTYSADVFPIIAYCKRILVCGAPAVFDANYQYLGKVVAGIIYRGLQKITVSLGQSQYVTFCIQELMLYLTTLL